MGRIVSLLLIPMFMLGQALPHSHAGSGVAEPECHSRRPHVHLDFDHHHASDGDDHDHHHASDDHGHHHSGQQGDTSDTDSSAAFSIPLDHDSGAVYFTQTDWTTTRTVASLKVDSSDLLWTSIASLFVCDPRMRNRLSDPPDRYWPRPIYLLTASFRL
jgi:hypothetical protein